MNPPPWATVTPLANEAESLDAFAEALARQLDALPGGTAFLVVDRASTDATPELCRALSASDPRFRTVWAPENRNVVDAYLRGHREALRSGAQHIVEIDGGLSHDPAVLPEFLARLREGVPCVYGSRFVPGGSMEDSPWRRRLLSWAGTLLANGLLGTRLADMTSGYQGFHRTMVERFCGHPLRSTAHFYQTEVKYLLRRHPSVEVPIRYRAPSPRVSRRALANALACLAHHSLRRLTLRADAL